MIFVTIGTSEPFDRLVRALDSLPPAEELVVQCGRTSVRPLRGECHEYLAFDRLVEYVREAHTVIMHAGAGSVLVALRNGVRPIVVPRLSSLGEAVDDHQVPFARRLEELGLAELVEDVSRLGDTVRHGSRATVARSEPADTLAYDLQRYLSSVID